MQIYARTIHTADQMLFLGRELASVITPGLKIYLQGALGTGKTTLVHGLLQGLGYKRTVKSPTYTLVEPYDLSGMSLYHFDLYRINHPKELDHIGLEDYFIPDAICVVEWPERGEKILPTPDLLCVLMIGANEFRNLTFFARTEEGKRCLKRFIEGK